MTEIDVDDIRTRIAEISSWEHLGPRIRRVVDRDVPTLLAEVKRLREHSTWLNTICWKITEALGDVPNGAGQIDGNPVDLADRLCAEVERLRAALSGVPAAREGGG